MVVIGRKPIVLEDLPALRDEVPAKREEVFRRKLALCSVIFNFNDPESEVNNKDRKRQTLLELVDYVNTPAGQQIFSESIMSDVVVMVKSNLGRSLPPPTPDFDPEEVRLSDERRTAKAKRRPCTIQRNK